MKCRVRHGEALDRPPEWNFAAPGRALPQCGMRDTAASSTSTGGILDRLHLSDVHPSSVCQTRHVRGRCGAGARIRRRRHGAPGERVGAQRNPCGGRPDEAGQQVRPDEAGQQVRPDEAGQQAHQAQRRSRPQEARQIGIVRRSERPAGARRPAAGARAGAAGVRPHPQGQVRRRDGAPGVDRRSGGQEAGRMDAAAPRRQPCRLQPLRRLHRRQSRLAEHSAAAPARRGAAVAAAPRRRVGAALRRRRAGRRLWRARARARAAGRRRSRRGRAQRPRRVA